MSTHYENGVRGPRTTPSAAVKRPIAGMHLFRIHGIDVNVDWSLLVIFFLVSFSLSTGVLAQWHPGWPPLLRWTVGVSAAVLFFASVLVHELSHAFVGRAQGIPIRGITLFVFGGVAHLDREPTSPKAELLMAIVGPLTSIAIGVAATIAGAALATPSVDVAAHPELAARAMGPLATILLWLGPVNVVLGVFNLVPGFPLDGGRVLRAILWWSTKDLEKATRWASASGRAFGFLLIACGVLMAFGFVVPFFGTGFGGGLWLVLIGWFLHNAARASYEQLVVRRRLEGVPVTHVMRSNVYTVSPDLSIADFVRDYVMGTDQTTFPVVRGDELLGLVSARAVREVPRDDWPSRTVAQAMMPAEPTLDAGAGADEALEKLASTDADQVPVVDHGRLRGVVRRNDILKWITLQPGVA